jgi:glycosyltransferase involved in cell wall biosynthesis
VRHAIDRLKPAVVHSNGIKFHMLTGMMRLRGVPVLWHVQDFLSPRPMMAKALRWASSRATGAIAISNSVGRDIASALGDIPIDVVYNSVDTRTFAPGPGDGASLDDLAGLPEAAPGTLRVGLAATFARWKGQDLFLQAIARVPCDVAARFYIIGGPIYRTPGSQFSLAELHELAASLGIADRVGFIGFQEEMVGIYRALDLVVHASTHHEPFGVMIAEAMSCGRPVILTKTSGAAELIDDGHDATTVEPGNVDALASAISELLADRPRRMAMSELARRTAVERFSRENVGPQMLEIYKRYATA